MKVREIHFIVHMENPDGELVRREAVFLRAEKIAELMTWGSLGKLLRDMIAPVPLEDVDVESISPPEKPEKKRDN